jgi:hypothetical protein
MHWILSGFSPMLNMTVVFKAALGLPVVCPLSDGSKTQPGAGLQNLHIYRYGSLCG